MRRMIWKNLLYGKQENDTEGENKGEQNKGAKDKDADNNQDKNLPTKSSLIGSQLKLSPDVDLAAIASKYELTGGFIKNAVLSALLSAISRQKLVKMKAREGLEGVSNGVGNGTSNGIGHVQGVPGAGEGEVNGHTTTINNNNNNNNNIANTTTTSSSSSSSSSSSNGHLNPNRTVFNPTAHAHRNHLLRTFAFGSQEEEPEICQEDLIKGCKLQMRGSLSGYVVVVIVVAVDFEYILSMQCNHY